MHSSPLTKPRWFHVVWIALAVTGVHHRAYAGVCPVSGNVDRDGWQVAYQITDTDGLEISQATFQGRQLLTQAKLVEWHADEGNNGFVLSTGCGGGGGGFPIFPYAAGVQITDLPGSADGVAGFEIVADFRMVNWGAACNYRFEQRFQFYEGGSFRPAVKAFGRDCSTGASVYRPVWRLDIAPDGIDSDRIELWTPTGWEARTTEFYRTPYADPDGPLMVSPQGYAARILDRVSDAGFLLEPDTGQLGTPGSGDQPFLYASLFKAQEGATDLGVIGTAAAEDHQQGPNTYIDGESIDTADIVLWYVPQMITDAVGPDYLCWTVTGEPNPETYPCWAGPLFRPTPMIFADGFESGDVGRWSVLAP